MDMHMRNFEPRDHQADSCRVEEPHLHIADGVRDLGEVSGLACWEVGPLVDFAAGHHQAVAAGKGPNVEKGNTSAVFVYESGTDLAVDDSSEYCGHVQIVGWQWNRYG